MLSYAMNVMVGKQCLQLDVQQSLLAKCFQFVVLRKVVSFCKKLFWMFWFRRAEYCTFKNSHTKEEYEVMVARILLHMQKKPV
jgi:hypothetical protein